MLKKAVPLIALIVLSGCVSTKNIPIDEARVEESKPGSILVAKRVKSSFSAMTSGKAALGLIGSAAMIAAGNNIIEENAVADPAIDISASLSDGLSKKYDLRVVDGTDYVESANPGKIAEAYSESASDWILDVQTINWSFTYFPTDWDNYRVIYSAKIRLVDARDRSMVAEGFCARVPEDDSSAPSHDELLAENAARLKSELKEAADHCIGEFKTKVLHIQG